MGFSFKGYKPISSFLAENCLIQLHVLCVEIGLNGRVDSLCNTESLRVTKYLSRITLPYFVSLSQSLEL